MQHNTEIGRLVGSDGIIANLYRCGCEDTLQLNTDGRWQFGSLMVAIFCDFNQHCTMHKQGRLDSGFWSSIEHNIKFYISRPGVMAWWQTQPFAMDASFTKYVYALISLGKRDKRISRSTHNGPIA